MKSFFLLLALFCVLKTNAQNYLIDFAGSGASTAVGSVKVENITAGTSITINGSDILNLNVMTGVTSPENNQSAQLKIYPNPMIGYSTLEIFPPAPGDAVISIFDIYGKQIAKILTCLESYRQDFRLSGISEGFYVVNVKGESYQISGKIVSTGNSGGIPRVEKVNNIIDPIVKEITVKDTKGAQSTVDMAYTTGDRLKFTGISGDYKTVRMDIPTGNKTIIFNFIACTDGDNNKYPVVEIGSQIWMAENLRTTKFADGNSIETTTPATLKISNDINNKYQWAYNGDEGFVTSYGRLYTWYAVNDIRNVCPTGWHVPSDGEWSNLGDYLANNGYGNIAKSMASTSGWVINLTAGTPGNDQLRNNLSGLTIAPSGIRYDDGTFGNAGILASIWSSTEADSDTARERAMYYNNSDLLTQARASKWMGLSVRCVRVL